MSATKEWFMSHEEQQSFQLVGDYPREPEPAPLEQPVDYELLILKQPI